LQQAADTFKQVHNLSDGQIGFVMQEYKEFGRPFIFSTIQTASRPKNLEILSKYKFDYVIIDEYHHVSALSYQNILDNLNTSFLLGLTATPFRHDHKEIMSNVDGEQNMVFTMDLENGIKQKVLVPFIYNVFYDNINYTNIKFSGYKYREADLNKTLLIPSRDNLIITKFKELIQDRQAVGFCCSVKHVDRMVALFNYHGIRAEGITHKTGYKSERKNIIDGFKRKDYQVLFTRDILNEGVDFPFVESLLFLRPTYSKVIFLQQLGRGLRLSPGKENVMILDFIGNYHNAYRIKDWLGFAEQNDEPVEGNKEQSRPEYIHKVAKVYFENKVIDIFDEQIRSISITPTVEQLKQNWLEVKENLGRIPIVEELNDKSLSKVSSHWYYKYYDNYSNFIVHMDEIPKWRKLAPYTTEQLEQNWLELKQKLGKVPTTKDLNDKNLGRFPTYTYEKKYGSYDNFLIHMNETPPQKAHPPYTKDELIAVYHKSKTDSNIRNSFVRGGLRHIVQRLFGNYANLAQEADRTTEYTTVCKRCNKKNVINDLRKQTFIFKEKIKYCTECKEYLDSHERYTIEDLIKNYKNLERILGRRPAADDLRRPNSIYSLGPYKSKYGSWNNFLASIGVTPIIKNVKIHNKQVLIDN
jgi:superfamily II DNA or RNA helicase